MERGLADPAIRWWSRRSANRPCQTLAIGGARTGITARGDEPCEPDMITRPQSCLERGEQSQTSACQLSLSDDANTRAIKFTFSKVVP
jgi:hypothetical protein